MNDDDDLGASYPTLDEVIHGSSGTDTSFSLIAAASLRAAVPPRDRKLSSLRRSVLVVQVPDASWIDDTVNAARKLWAGSRVVACRADVKSKMEADVEARLHVSGKGIVLVSDSPQTSIPEALRTASSRQYVMKLPSRRAFIQIARFIVSGNVGRAFSRIDISGLDYQTLCLCLVMGDTAAQAAEKLKHALAALQKVTSAVLPNLVDLHGFGEAKRWALELVTDLRAYRDGNLTWSEIDHGAVLFGSPGVGKSLFMRVVAKEAGIPIVQASVAEYFSKGSGHLEGVIRAQRQVFAKASSLAPCILFLDELDAMPKRGSGSRNEDFWRPVINDFLMLLDSAMSSREGVVVCGATNRIEDIDMACLRPGRMDKLLYIPSPGARELEAIMRYYLKGELAEEDLTPLVYARAGATGADVVLWLKAARRRARSQGRPLELKDLQLQVFGSQVRSKEFMRRCAVHEVGHAIAALALGVPVMSISIVSDLDAGGVATVDLVGEGLMTKDRLEANVVVMLAGRAAETVLLGPNLSTAAGGSETSDLARATQLLTSMHMTLGMGSSLVYRTTRPDQETADAINADLRRYYEVAIGIMITHVDIAWKMVDELCGKGVLDAAALNALFPSAAQP